MKIITVNRKARYDYHIMDRWEAGLKLLGPEVKALRAGNVSIAEAWIKILQNRAVLVGSNITATNVSKWQEYDPNRDRILLLHKKELKKLNSATQGGLTIIPLKLYFNPRGLAKLEIATAKGKKKYDKRKKILERDLKRYGV
jgi:SsrA-binding protein